MYVSIGSPQNRLSTLYHIKYKELVGRSQGFLLMLHRNGQADMHDDVDHSPELRENIQLVVVKRGT
jgi:hypothetical protein